MPNRICILLIEDEGSTAQAMDQQLGSQGYRVVVVSKLGQAVKALHNQEFCCVILNYFLKNEGGEQLFNTINKAAKGRNSKTQILVLGSHFTPEMMTKLAGEIQGAFVKPIDLERLGKKVREVCPPS